MWCCIFCSHTIRWVFDDRWMAIQRKLAFDTVGAQLLCCKVVAQLLHNWQGDAHISALEANYTNRLLCIWADFRFKIATVNFVQFMFLLHNVHNAHPPLCNRDGSLRTQLGKSARLQIVRRQCCLNTTRLFTTHGHENVVFKPCDRMGKIGAVGDKEQIAKWEHSGNSCLSSPRSLPQAAIPRKQMASLCSSKQLALFRYFHT